MYDAWFHYREKGKDYIKGEYVYGSCLISSFSVLGGAYRSINLASTYDYITISSELEEARRYKNITLFMAPTGDHVDMKTAVDLTDAAYKTMLLSISLTFKRFAQRYTMEEYTLRAETATIKQPPRIVAEHLLMIEVCLLSPKLFQGIRGMTLEEESEAYIR
jgi:hypothetical protein